MPTTPIEILAKYLDSSPIIPEDRHGVARHRWLLGLVRLALDVGYEEGQRDTIRRIRGAEPPKVRSLGQVGYEAFCGVQRRYAAAWETLSVKARETWEQAAIRGVSGADLAQAVTGAPPAESTREAWGRAMMAIGRAKRWREPKRKT